MEKFNIKTLTIIYYTCIFAPLVTAIILIIRLWRL